MVANTLVENGVTVNSLSIKVVKGNELTDLITETFDGEDFQDTLWSEHVQVSAFTNNEHIVEFGMNRGRDSAVAVRVSKQIAALGVRGDYILFELDVTEKGTAAYAVGEQKNFMVEAMDYSGVPAEIQYGVFGKYSPFTTPPGSHDRKMLLGVDKQKIELVNSVLLTADNTYKDQKIRGVSTDRLQAKVDVNDTPTKITIKVKPAADGCIVIKRGAIIWAGDGITATRTNTTA